MLQATTAPPGNFVTHGNAKPQTVPAKGKRNGMRKVLLMVTIAIVVFMAFTAYSVQKAVQGSAQLAAIKDLYFPVLLRLDANAVRTDKIEELYIQVVIAGDRDIIGKAKELVAQEDQVFAEIAALYPGRETTVATLRTDLKKYQELATKASLAFLDPSLGDTTPLTTGMNDALATLRQDLTAFREASYSSFTQALAGSQRDARVHLSMGLALGVMNLGFMAVLVFFIRNNIKMMEVIAVQNATLEARVAERTSQLNQKTNDINTMLQNMKLGVSTVIPGNLIHPEYSNYLCTIFSIDNLAGKDLIASLFERSSLGVDVKDQISAALWSILGEDAMMFDLNSHLLANEMRLMAEGGTHKVIQMDWSPIVGPHGTVDKVLLITQDVTHLRELEESAAHQKEELDIISRILRISAGKFNDFVDAAGNYIAENRRLISAAAAPHPAVIAALFRNMHTIKGNARVFEFTQITDAAHCAEQTYDTLRNDEQALWDVRTLSVQLDAVAAAIAQYTMVNEEKLGRKGRSEDLTTSRGAFVSNEQLSALRSMAARLHRSHSDVDTGQMQKAIDQLGFVSLKQIVAGSVDALDSLANEMRKPAPLVEIVGEDVAFNTEFAETLKSCCMHILRNSLDHGIETPADRTLDSKPAQGTIHFVCERKSDHVELRIGDDGKGLALHALHARGLANGWFGAGEHPPRDSVADLIFRPGLSTAAQVTQTSGRGVGMDAVRTFLMSKGASIRVALKEPSRAELGFAPFELIIHVPASAFSHWADPL